MESPSLFFREELSFIVRTNLKEAISSRCQLHPRNNLRESVDDFSYVWNHINLHRTRGGEIKIHTKVVMLGTADNIKLLVSSVIALSKPIQKGGDNSRVDSTCPMKRSSTCQQIVICLPLMILLATQGSYGLMVKPKERRSATSLR